MTLPGNFVDSAFVAGVPDVCRWENEWPVNLWPYFAALLGSFGEYDWLDELAGLEVPRLVMHGREDGIPIEGARAWVTGFPEARLLELSPAGHFPFLERREEFLAAVDAFLDGHARQHAGSTRGPRRDCKPAMLTFLCAVSLTLPVYPWVRYLVAPVRERGMGR